MKNKVNNLDFHKLLPVPVDLIKLIDLVKTCIVKKDIRYVKIKNIEDKIPDITNLVTNAFLNAKIRWNIYKAAALTTVKNKIPNISYQTKKSRLWYKNIRSGKKYILLLLIIIISKRIHLIQRYQKNLVHEADLNEKIKKLATKEEIKTLVKKPELKAEQGKIVKLQTYDLSFF